MRRQAVSLAATGGLVCLQALAGSLQAQSWLPPAGEGYFSLGYGNTFATDHYLGTAANPGDNVETNRGHMRSQFVTAAIGYGITDHLELAVGLPFASGRWYPAGGIGAPHPGSNADNGDYHGAFQDFRIQALYQVVREPVALTPFVAAVIPSHSYTYLAHSAIGRDLHEYLVGVNFGSGLDRLLPGGYVQAMYSYAFVERVLDIHHDRSNAALELGYFVTPSLGARFLATGFYTHGGLSFRQPSDLGPGSLSNPIFVHHDQIGHESGISLGGGLSYALTGSVDVYATYMRTVLGHLGVRIEHGIAFGFSWGFSPKQVARGMFGPRSVGGEPAVQP
ncbi:MAG TPA: hypothetical protein VMR54_00145 [Thermoanaerobaculia bacterium]|nr:hypothetical protein [Thermoanaerobaculia bacterium]